MSKSLFIVGYDGSPTSKRAFDFALVLIFALYDFAPDCNIRNFPKQLCSKILRPL